MIFRRDSLLALVAVLALATILSCGDDPPAVTAPPPDPSVPTTLSINPASVVFTAIGDTVRFTAEVRDQDGNVMTGAAVNWASTAPSVASIAASGLARAVGDGTASITANADAAADSAAVAVRRQVARVVVSPATAELEVGDTLRLTAEAPGRQRQPAGSERLCLDVRQRACRHRGLHGSGSGAREG